MVASKKRYRLGLDLGTNSIGWFMIWLDEAGKPSGLGPGGVRIFPDGRDQKSKESNAKSRRLARGMRRRRDRYLRRRDRLMDELMHFGLMPSDVAERKALEQLDPYELRATGLDDPLPLHHIGRALFHLNQRRGFKSNRKTDGGDDESGPIKEAVGKLQTAIEGSGARTLGEFLWGRQRKREGVRARNSGAVNKVSYDFYPSRKMLEEELEMFWEAQARHHPEMTETARAALRETILFQRPLRAQPVGKCSLDPAKSPDDIGGFRMAHAHPLAQRFRILQEVNNLQYGDARRGSVSLDYGQREKLVLALTSKKQLTFDRMRGLLKLPEGTRFNLESEKRKDLKGDETAAKLSHKDLFHKGWREFPRVRQIEIVERLLTEHDDDAIHSWLIENAEVDAATAHRIANTLLPDGHSRLGSRAITKLLPIMEEGRRYDEAATELYGSHSMKKTGEIVDRLPYYGAWMPDAVSGSGDERADQEARWGRLPNPTVHIGLGQLRRVVNAIVKEHGPPEEAVVEMTRSFKLPPAHVKKLEREQAVNQEKNEDRNKTVEQHGQRPNARNRLKLRLWEELDPLDRCCPFTGERISIGRLLSDEVEIEHLIPFSQSWDDSAANKVVCMRFANRAKGQRTPNAAFGNSPTINGFAYDWDAIGQRASNFPSNKRWRFGPDAMDRFQKEGGFLANQLNDTSWFARLAKDYVEGLTGPYKVWVVPGRMTEMIRAKWGLNSLLPDHNFTDRKNRADHRHHAIDALVVGLTDRSLLQAMASVYDEDRDRVKVPEPWETLRDDLGQALNGMTASHRMDHAASDQLHEATAYGVVANSETEDGNLVYRKAFLSLNKSEVRRIRDIRLREMVERHVELEAAQGKDFDEALARFEAAHENHPHVRNGLRHVRLLKTEKPEYLVAIEDKKGRSYKAYAAGGNAFIDLFETPDGKWHGEATTVFHASQKDHRPAWRDLDDARFIMRVRKGDLLAIDHDGSRTVMVIRVLEASANRFRLAGHNEAGNLTERHNEESDPFRWLMPSYNRLKSLNAERVRCDDLGRVWRIPPKEGECSL
jgi:CRISPR-associated endonuclease Csn1